MRICTQGDHVSSLAHFPRAHVQHKGSRGPLACKAPGCARAPHTWAAVHARPSQLAGACAGGQQTLGSPCPLPPPAVARRRCRPRGPHADPGRSPPRWPRRGQGLHAPASPTTQSGTQHTTTPSGATCTHTHVRTHACMHACRHPHIHTCIGGHCANAPPPSSPVASYIWGIPFPVHEGQPLRPGHLRTPHTARAHSHTLLRRVSSRRCSKGPLPMYREDKDTRWRASCMAVCSVS
jgi:hypothetical protein